MASNADPPAHAQHLLAHKPCVGKVDTEKQGRTPEDQTLMVGHSKANLVCSQTASMGLFDGDSYKNV